MSQRLALPDVLNLGCGEDQHPQWHNIDVVESVGPDEVVDLNTTPWPWPDGSFTTIYAHHVFEHLSDIELTLRECARILRSGGRLVVTLPVGVNADADPDHTWGRNGRPWTWQTPEFYCGARHWDVDVGLRAVDKSVELHTHYSFFPFKAFQHVKWRVEQWWNGSGEWAFRQPAASAEFRVVFEKP